MRSLACLPFVFVMSCAVTSDPYAGEESALLGNCGFIPGCSELLEAGDGPFTASVMTYEVSGETRRRLAVTYRESVGSSFLVCSRFPNQPPLTLVFVLGSAGAETSLRQPMRVECPSAWGDNQGFPNSATFSIVEDADPALWDTLFPPSAEGDRWYALQLAATNAQGEWDSHYGSNYRLVLQPR